LVISIPKIIHISNPYPYLCDCSLILLHVTLANDDIININTPYPVIIPGDDCGYENITPPPTINNKMINP
jgi:hypothetical protein